MLAMNIMSKVELGNMIPADCNMLKKCECGLQARRTKFREN